MPFAEPEASAIEPRVPDHVDAQTTYSLLSLELKRSLISPAAAAHPLLAYGFVKKSYLSCLIDSSDLFSSHILYVIFVVAQCTSMRMN